MLSLSCSLADVHLVLEQVPEGSSSLARGKADGQNLPPEFAQRHISNVPMDGSHADRQKRSRAGHFLESNRDRSGRGLGHRCLELSFLITQRQSLDTLKPVIILGMSLERGRG